MTRAISILCLSLAAGAACGCVYGPDHLPALRTQRDQFQRYIDDVVSRMATDREWWSSLSPADRERWRSYLEAMRADERERAMSSLQTINQGINLAGGTPDASDAPPSGAAER